jgi:alcohol dehydrogenase (NADP+)
MATIANGKGCFCLAAFDLTSGLKKHEFGRPAPSSNAVAVDIKYCGMCHSDLHATNGDWGMNFFPLAPGHEIAGIVAAVGTDVTKFKVGDRVGVGCLVESCGSCDLCQKGEENYCVRHVETYGTIFPEGKGGEEFKECVGHVTNGGYSTSIVVSEHFVFPVPESISLEHVGPLLCAGITTFSPLNKYILKHGSGQGKKVGIVGFGGLGHMAVKLAKAMGCDVTVLSRSAAKADAAKKLGADMLVHTDEEDVKSHFRSFDLVVDTVSEPHPIQPLLSVLKVGGTWHLLGGVSKPVEIGAMSLLFNHQTISGSLIGGVPETQQMLDFCAKHGILPDIEVIPASAANKQFLAMAAGASDANRFVIDMSTLKDM